MLEENLIKLEKLAQLVRYYSLVSTTAAGSGHPTSCLSATDLMVALMFAGYFRADLNDPKNPNNDRLIFSKGHAAPLLYALYAAAGKLSEDELLTLRKIDSRLEGHPTPSFEYAEASTGSLGQGLGIGLGMALNAKMDNLDYKTYVLLGDGEMAEGSVWEAVQLASYYKLNNLVGILDVNGYGLTGKTMVYDQVDVYVNRLKSFGWEAIKVDGHNLEKICEVFDSINQISDRPVMIVAKTKKGAGVDIPELANLHGKVLSKDQLQVALQILGEVDKTVIGEVSSPTKKKPNPLRSSTKIETKSYQPSEQVATREAYGQALAELVVENQDIVVLDADLSTSTFAVRVKEVDPNRFWEMYIAEQNMVSTATGLALRGKTPFCSSFAAFLTRAMDQIRMARYSDANVKFCGSHAGVSVGEDGFSQMGLEDISMFRAIPDSVVLYPSDATSAKALTKELIKHNGIGYIRTSRPKTPILYELSEVFTIGGSKTLRSSDKDLFTIVAAGVTLHEAIKAADLLLREKICIRVIDLYSVKPLDGQTLVKAVSETKAIIVVEDHYKEGGMYSAVCEFLANPESGVTRFVPIYSMSVTKIPRSGTPESLLEYVGINAAAIVKKVKELV